jgi:hypothetical protein
VAVQRAMDAPAAPLSASVPPTVPPTVRRNLRNLLLMLSAPYLTFGKAAVGRRIMAHLDISSEAVRLLFPRAFFWLQIVNRMSGVQLPPLRLPIRDRDRVMSVASVQDTLRMHLQLEMRPDVFATAKCAEPMATHSFMTLRQTVFVVPQTASLARELRVRPRAVGFGTSGIILLQRAGNRLLYMTREGATGLFCMEQSKLVNRHISTDWTASRAWLVPQSRHDDVMTMSTAGRVTRQRPLFVRKWGCTSAYLFVVPSSRGGLKRGVFLPLGESSAFWATALSSDGEPFCVLAGYVLSADDEMTETVRVRTYLPGTNHLALTPDGTWLAAAGTSGWLDLVRLDPDSHICVQHEAMQLPPPNVDVVGMQFSKDGNNSFGGPSLAVVSSDRLVVLFFDGKGALAQRLCTHTATEWRARPRVAVSVHWISGRRLLVLCRDRRSAFAVDLQFARATDTYEMHSKREIDTSMPIGAICDSGDGHAIVSMNREHVQYVTV